MKKTVVSMALLVLTGAPTAIAQTGAGSGASKSGGSIPQAPIGHRQPRADEVPNEKNLGNPNDPINKEDAALDKKIKSICRGC
ncbi:MAG TPA: hypothetical protein VGH70_03415 [Bradyrhizobium sp.]